MIEKFFKSQFRKKPVLEFRFMVIFKDYILLKIKSVNKCGIK